MERSDFSFLVSLLAIVAKMAVYTGVQHYVVCSSVDVLISSFKDYYIRIYIYSYPCPH